MAAVVHDSSMTLRFLIAFLFALFLCCRPEIHELDKLKEPCGNDGRTNVGYPEAVEPSLP
jgi:hypothetical protein